MAKLQRRQFTMRTKMTVLVLALAFTAVLHGQAAKPAAPAEQPAPTISSILERQLNGLEKNIVGAAEAMPEDKYNFSPESLTIPGSDYKGVRSFAMEVKHIATANYLFWGAITGDKPAYEIKGPNGPDEVKTKSEILKFLKDSFAVGHKAVATVNSENLLEMVPFRTTKAPRLGLVSDELIHANDHYGQMVEYLRMSGVVPPASRPRN
jgi:uncharacterized damage-inducible protein DinB